MRPDRRGLFARLLPGLFVVALIAGPLLAQEQPSTRPATQPTGRGARGAGRGPVVASPRDQLPFANTNIANAKPGLPTFFICGDSTAANGDPTHRGWGAVLIDYFDADKLNIVNYSQGGINFPSYYTSRWPRVVEALKPGDFVVVELGHNGGHLPGTGDETGPGGRRGAAASPGSTLPSRGNAGATTRGPGAGEVHTFGWYIRTMIRDARAKGATTIVSSTTVRFLYTNPNGKFDTEFGTLLEKNDKYNPADDRVERGMGDLMPDGRRTMLVWAEQVAKEEKAPFVDHSDIAADYYEKIGREAAQKFHLADRTHFGTEGAIVQAETFIAGLKALPDMPLINSLNEKGKAIEAYKAPVK